MPNARRLILATPPRGRDGPHELATLRPPEDTIRRDLRELAAEGGCCTECTAARCRRPRRSPTSQRTAIGTGAKVEVVAPRPPWSVPARRSPWTGVDRRREPPAGPADLRATVITHS